MDYGRSRARCRLAITALLLVPAILSAPGLAWGQESGASPRAAAEPYADAIARFRAWVEPRLERDGLPGLSIGFRVGEFAWADGFGFADLENGVPATADSSYRLASVTKPMTAIGVLKLVEQGKVDLDAEVQRYVPHYPRKSWPVTVRQVLGHLGGISHYRNYDLEGHFKQHMDTRESIGVFADFDLVAEPGTAYNYSSYGYNLLGAVIEGASGRSYARFMHEYLWDPLGMTSTRMDDPYALIPNRVRGYQRGADGHLLNSEFVDISSRFAAGGTRSTVVDLLALGRGLDEGVVLPPALVDQMLTSMATRDGYSTGYGMGWGVRPVNGRFAASHGGGQAETATYFLWFPDLELSIALATNLEGADRMPYVRRLYEEVVGEPWSVPVYVGGRAREWLLLAMQMAWADGLSHAEHVGEPITEDLEALEEAFETFNDDVDLRAIMADFDAATARIRSLGHPAGGRRLQVVGSYMASKLLARLDADAVRRLHRDGPIAFFDAYIRLYQADDVAVPADLRFETAFETLVGHWAEDWAQTWNERTYRMKLTLDDDLEGRLDQLQAAFLGSSVYPDYWSEMEPRVEVLARQGRIEQASMIAEAGRRLYPHNAAPHFYAGLLRLAGGRPDEAEALIKHARKLDSDYVGPDALNGWAYRLRSSGFADLGLAVLELAVRIHPGDANLYDSLGEFHLDRGDEEAAVGFYRKALEIDPSFESPRRALAEIAGGAGGAGGGT